jgi:tetratricopeptide (TPR) repeat protein
MASGDYTHDVFISYNRAQEEWAEGLARRLRDAGLRVWFAPWSLRPGEAWIRGLERGVQESHYFVAVASPEWVEAAWPNLEAQMATLLDPAARAGRIIPLLHTPCDLPASTAIRQWIDFTDTHGDAERFEFRLAQLVATLDPAREYPQDFEAFRCARPDYDPDALPPPGPLPAGSRMPFAYNPLFVGRQEELRALARSLLGEGQATVISQVAAATGLGGIGKTQLAAAFVHRYGRGFSGGVFWLDMGIPDGIAEQVAECGGPGHMNLPGWPALTLPERVTAVRGEWQKPVRRLLVFDNAESPQVVDEWKPATGGAHVLVTSRCQEWPPAMGVQPLRLDTLPRADSLALLCRGQGHKGPPESCPICQAPANHAALAGICDTLGDLPLALHLAASYLHSYRHTLAPPAYLERLRAQPVLKDASLVGGVHDPSPTRHVQNVAATFRMSYDKLDPEEPSDALAQRIFAAAGHFAPGVAIPRELLQAALQVDSPQALGPALHRLRDLGLLELDDAGDPRLHQLLAAFAQGTAGAPEQSQAVAQAIVEVAYEANAGGLPGSMAPILPHLRNAATRAEAQGAQVASYLYGNLGCHLRAVADYRAARRAFERALHILEQQLGPVHADVATLANNLGNVLRDLGDLPAARQAFLRALRIWEKQLGPVHANVATAVNNLGGVLHDLGDLPAARQAFLRALHIDEAAFGPDHPNVARDVNNLGSVLHDLGDLPAARQAFVRALPIDEAAFGPDHPNVAIRVNNLGSVLQELGDLPAARQAFMRALRIDEAAFGPDHPNVARDVNNLGSVLQELGDVPAARQAYERALRIDEAAFGPDHPNVAIGVNNLGRVLQGLGDLPAARRAFERALRIWEKQLGPVHANVATALSNLGLVLHDLGDLPAARQAFLRALRIDEAAFGPDHPNVARDVNNLGSVLQELGDLPAARQACDRALRIFERAYGPDHPKTRTVRENLQTLQRRAGRE